MAPETIAVTGGSGLIGSAVIADLAERGYRTVNLDRTAPANDGGVEADEYLSVDLLDAGSVYAAFDQVGAEAVIHMGTIPSLRHHTGHETFENNAMTSYHVLEAAAALEIDRVCLASSINAIGYSYQDAPTEIRYLPVDEDHPRTPRDAYALGKAVTEEICDGFARQQRPPTTIGTLRFPFVATDEQLRERYAAADRSLEAVRAQWDPDGPSNDLFVYLHVDDAARIARAVIEAEFDGHETFWAVAADTTADVPTARLIEEFHPDVEVRAELDGHESLISTENARRLLGWEPTRSWRDL